MSVKTSKIPTLSFKRRPRFTGLAAIGEKDSWDIKVGKKVCGGISLEGGMIVNYDRQYQISFAVKSGEHFKWINLTKKFPRINGGEEAMKFLKEQWSTIYTKLFVEKYQLHFLE